MKNINYLQFVLIVILGISCLDILGKINTEDESFEAIKEKLMAKIKKDGHLEIDECRKLCNKPFKKCMESEKAFEKGSFIYDMFHNRELHNFSVHLVIKYMKNTPISQVKRQEIFNFLLKNVTKKNPEWMQIDARFILTSFNKKDYNEESSKIVKDLILKDGCKRYAFFLIDRAGIYDDPKIIKFLKAKSKHYKLWSWRNKTPWFALLIMARNGDKDAIKKVIKLANIPNKKYRKSQVQLMPVQMSYVQQPEIVEQLKQFLKSKESYFKGNDTVPRHADLSHAAARALSNMIVDYPKINNWGYTEKMRKECIDWFDKHKEYKFDKKAKLLFY